MMNRIRSRQRKLALAEIIVARLRIFFTWSVDLFGPTCAMHSTTVNWLHHSCPFLHVLYISAVYFDICEILNANQRRRLVGRD